MTKRRFEYVVSDREGVERRAPVNWVWVFLPYLGFMLAFLMMFLSYGSYRKQRTQALELREEIHVLRTSNKKLALLEQELLELRELQQQMLRLVGVERALGIDLKLLKEMQAASADSSGHELLLWPIKGELLADYSDQHPAVDLGAPKGTTVVSPGDGVVLRTAGQEHEHSITIDHEDGVTTVIRTLSMVLVDPGDQLSAGQVIGLVGEGGHQEQPYVHFQVLLENQPVKPQEFVFQETPWAVP